MGLFGKATNYVTYYRDEEDLHPRFRDAFAWYDALITRCVSATYRDQVLLAGGALRSFFMEKPVRDYDIYCTKEGLTGLNAAFGDFFQPVDGGWSKTSETNLSYTYKNLSYDTLEQKINSYALNVIKKPYTTHDSVIDSFDFTVCMCAINSSAIVYHPDYFTDLGTRRLRVHNPEDPLSTLWRMQKYIKLGFTMDREELWKIAKELHEEEKLPILVATDQEKYSRSLKENAKTLAEIFRSS